MCSDPHLRAPREMYLHFGIYMKNSSKANEMTDKKDFAWKMKTTEIMLAQNPAKPPDWKQ